MFLSLSEDCMSMLRGMSSSEGDGVEDVVVVFSVEDEENEELS